MFIIWVDGVVKGVFIGRFNLKSFILLRILKILFRFGVLFKDGNEMFELMFFEDIFFLFLFNLGFKSGKMICDYGLL